MAKKTNRREAFVKLANKRVNRVLNDFRLIGNLANKSNYVYTDEQANKIIAVLEAETSRVKTLFDQKGDPNKTFDIDSYPLGGPGE